MDLRKNIVKAKKYRNKFNQLNALLDSSDFFKRNINIFILINTFIRLIFVKELFKKERSTFFFFYNNIYFYKNIRFLLYQFLMTPIILTVIYLTFLVNKKIGLKILSLFLSFLSPYQFFFSHKVSFIIDEKRFYSKFLSEFLSFFGHSYVYFELNKNLSFSNTKIQNPNKKIIEINSVNKKNIKKFINVCNSCSLTNQEFFIESNLNKFKDHLIKEELEKMTLELRVFFKNNFLKGVDIMDTINFNLDNTEERIKWDSFIKLNAPDAIFHYSCFLKLFNSDPFILSVIMGDIEIQGIDLILKESNLGIKYSGPVIKKRNLFKKESTYQEYQSKMMSSITRTRAFHKKHYKEVFFSDNSINEFLCLGQEFNIRETFCIDISVDKEELFLNLETKIRTDIRKAKKNNLKCRFIKKYEFGSIDLDMLKEVPDLLLDIDKLDSEIYDVYISVVHDNDIFISGVIMIGCKFGETLFYIHAIRNKTETKGGSQSLAIWNVIENANSNYKKIDFLGSRDQNIRRFFRGFGGKIYNKKELV